MAKLFSTIIGTRVERWAEENNLLPTEQFGFRKNHRTSDCIFILKTCIESKTKQKKSLYSCFVDFRKAFNRVCQLCLWKKLRNLGISQKMVAMLQTMYSQANSRVKGGDGSLSESIPAKNGVRQGCPLSPLLFPLFIADIPKLLREGGTPGVQLDERSLSSLLFADDLVLMANTKEELQRALDVLLRYSELFGLQVNELKTNAMIFSNSYAISHQKSTEFLLNGKSIEIVDQYKYLGILFTSNGKLTKAKATLSQQARKAHYALFKAAKSSSFPPTRVMCKLFDSLVMPVLTYSAKVWGIAKCEEVERVQYQFCKYVLQLPSKESNAATLTELGRYSVLLNTQTKAIKYAYRLQQSNTPPCLLAAYRTALKNNLSWVKEIREMLSTIDLPAITPDTSFQTFVQRAKQQIKAGLLAEWQCTLWKDREDPGCSTKLRLYRLYKQRYAMEPYLDIIVSQHQRKTLVRFRTSSHQLEIEAGRYHRPQTPPEASYVQYSVWKMRYTSFWNAQSMINKDSAYFKKFQRMTRTLKDYLSLTSSST